QPAPAGPGREAAEGPAAGEQVAAAEDDLRDAEAGERADGAVRQAVQGRAGPGGRRDDREGEEGHRDRPEGAGGPGEAAAADGPGDPRAGQAGRPADRLKKGRRAEGGGRRAEVRPKRRTLFAFLPPSALRPFCCACPPDPRRLSYRRLTNLHS